MIDRTQLEHLRPAQRADLIYREAQSELAQSLWRAAIGNEERDGGASGSRNAGGLGFGLDSLLALVAPDGGAARPHCGCPHAPTLSSVDAPPAAAAPAAPPAPASAASASPVPVADNGLGPNARYGVHLNSAAERTGIPAPALAAIIDAEAARGAGGAWNCHSRNPRSSAAGLGQFVTRTWIGEAERSGTWLNAEAARRGWLDDSGQVTAAARSSVLALRYDPEASIEATADYAAHNLQRLRRSGIEVGEGVSDIARSAYLAHHLGPGDAVRFLARGLDDGRASRLLSAQIGASGAGRRIADAGDASAAHRSWLLSYVDRRIRPERFAAEI